MKRSVTKLGLLLMSITLVLIISACGSSETDTTSSDNDNQNQETFKLTLNSAYETPTDESEPTWAGVDYLAQLIEEKTDGRVKVDVFYSSQLVGVNEALDALKVGSIDMQGATAYWGDLVPTQDLRWLPFAFKGEEQTMHVLRNTDVGKIMEKNLEEYGVKTIAYWPSSTQGFMTKKPVRTLEDMNGLSIRLASGLWTDWYKSMGAAPSNIAGAEQYEALSRGTIDGTMYPYYTLESFNLHEVLDYLILPGLFDASFGVTYMSLGTWNKLPEDIQKIIEEEVVPEVEKKATELSLKKSQEAIEDAKKHGVEIITLSDEELNKFIESAQPLWDEYESRSEDTKRIVEIIREEQEKAQ